MTDVRRDRIALQRNALRAALIVRGIHSPSGGFADDELDDESLALLAAIEEYVGEASRAWDPSKHHRIPKGQPGAGRFRSMVDRIKEALDTHFAEGGKGDPFDGFSREQLRRVARKRGIALDRGEGRESIAGKLLDHIGAARPRREPPASGGTQSGDARVDQAKTAVIDAYSALAGPGSGWVRLAELRQRLGDSHSREDVDKALRQLNRMPGVSVVPEANQKSLTKADREAAVVIGDQRKHSIRIDGQSAVGSPPQQKDDLAEQISKAKEGLSPNSLRLLADAEYRAGKGWAPQSDVLDTARRLRAQEERQRERATALAKERQADRDRVPGRPAASPSIGGTRPASAKSVSYALALLRESGYSTQFMKAEHAPLGASSRERSGTVEDWLRGMSQSRISQLISGLEA